MGAGGCSKDGGSARETRAVTALKSCSQRGAGAPDLLAAKIRAIREAAVARGMDVFIDARTDVYLRALAPDEQRVDETLARAALYRQAGADGLFVPGLVDVDAIRTVSPPPADCRST